jgi:ribosomal protein S18 acetylase RimI-like enzyme
MQIRSYQISDEEAVLSLWEECGLVVTWNNPKQDIQRKLKVQPELFLIGCIDDKIITTAMAGYDGHRGWVYYLAVKPNMQNQGIGRQIMHAVEERLITFGCPKIDIMVRTTNLNVISFYKAIGYKIDAVSTLSKRLIEDE